MTEEKKPIIDRTKVIDRIVAIGIAGFVSFAILFFKSYTPLAQTKAIEVKIKNNTGKIKTINDTLKVIKKNQCTSAILQFGKVRAIEICKP